MIHIRNNDLDDRNNLDTWLDKVVKRYNIDENINISFRSCNYDTYITKAFDGDGNLIYIVSSCNNHSWYSHITTLDHNIPLSYDDLCFYYYSSGERYWFLENDIIAKPSDKYCDSCGADKILLNALDICPKCDKGFKYTKFTKALNNAELLAKLKIEELRKTTPKKFNIRVDNYK